MTATCPSCGAPQRDGLLCADDTAALTAMLAAAPQLLEQLNIAVAKQSRLGTGGRSSRGTAHERDPVNWGTAAVRDALVAELAWWGTDIPTLRRDPHAARALTAIGRAVKAGYRAIDRLADRQYLGQCLADQTCTAELWARPGTRTLQCPACAAVHEVADRRAWLLRQAEDLLVTVREASRYVGEIGHIRVTEASIRGYLFRERIAYRPGGTLIRLGDLLAVVLEDAERRTA